MVKAIRVLYDNSRSAVMVNGMLSNRFEITTGVLQRDVLAPYLFVIVIDHVLVTATTQCQSGLVTHPRQSRRHPATVLNDLDFADDICPFECSTCSAQAQINSTASAAAQVGLKISVPKTEYMMYNIPSPGNLQADGEDIKQVSNFCYLGSLVADSKQDFRRRKGVAWSAFWKMEKLWRKESVPLDIKLKIFQISCLSVLLYGCESWILTKDLKKSINAFATSCFRIMLHIKRTDRVPNTELYRMVRSGPLASTVLRRQLTFLGHLLRMDSSQPAHIYALYCPPHGRRRPGSQHINYLRYIQECLGDYLGMITPSQICKLAMDRTAWRKAVVDCCAAEG